MKRKGKLLVTLSSLTTLFAGLVAYAAKVQASDEPAWLSGWAIEKRSFLSVVLLCLTGLGTGVEWLRSIRSSAAAEQEVVQRLLNEFARRQFGDDARKHRVTLFRVAPGWRVKFITLFRFPWWPLDRHKAAAWWRIDPRLQYLYAYLRCEGVRNARSSAAFLVHDNAQRCEGMAGRVWDEGRCQISQLPKFDPGELRNIKTVADLDLHPRAADIRKYMKETNMQDPKLLASLQHYAQHFYGLVVKGNTNVPWGVLLLDSEADRCPFGSRATGQFQKDYQTFAVMLGKILS